jgi:hypothetical protein
MTPRVISNREQAEGAIIPREERRIHDFLAERDFRSQKKD